MTYDEVIEKIIIQVEAGSKGPFMIFRDEKGGWHGEYIQNQYGDTYDWVSDIKDPFAVTVTGNDLAMGSFAYVYDNILCNRLRTEYEKGDFYDADASELKAIINMLEENIGEFSNDATNYLTTLDRPLAAIYDMASVSLISNYRNYEYNYSKINDFVEAIETKIKSRLYNRLEQETSKTAESAHQDNHSDKRVFDGYEEIAAIQVNRRLVFLGENKAAEHQYMVAEFTWNNPFGALDSRFAGVTSDYVEDLDKFSGLTEYNINVVKSGFEHRKNQYGVEPLTLTTADCVPKGLADDLEGKLIVIKPEALSPEYRRADYQLRICTGGFGAMPKASGRAVFCTDLFNGKDGRFEREDVLGVADLGKMPQWAVDKFSEYQGLKERAKAVNTPAKKATLQEKLDMAKHKAAQEGAKKSNQDDRPKKHKGMEV